MLAWPHRRPRANAGDDRSFVGAGVAVAAGVLCVDRPAEQRAVELDGGILVGCLRSMSAGVPGPMLVMCCFFLLFEVPRGFRTVGLLTMRVLLEERAVCPYRGEGSHRSSRMSCVGRSSRRPGRSRPSPERRTVSARRRFRNWLVKYRAANAPTSAPTPLS